MSRQLSSAELKSLGESTGMNEADINSWYNQFVTACPTGQMDKKQFHDFYNQLRGSTHPNLEKIADNVFRSFDKDSSQFLDFSEFLIAYSATSNGDIRKKLDFVFLFYDADKDGNIDAKEFLTGVELMQSFRGLKREDYTPEKAVKEIFKQIDINGDAQLSREEFIEACAANKFMLDLLSPFE
jgi:Ca2+-binding EF-hand superfamily protein